MIFRLFYFATCALFAASAAYAADGVIEINQASVDAADGFPFEITAPGSYKLTGDLTVPDADTTGIEVSAANVTIDLNGFGIFGSVECTREGAATTVCPASSAGTGILFQEKGGGVRNGTIRGMGRDGVSGPGLRVENIHASHNAGTAIVAGSVTATLGVVKGCTAELNRFGVRANGVIADNAIFFSQTGSISGGGVIRGNSIWGSGGVAIQIQQVRSVITDNVVDGSLGDVSVMVVSSGNRGLLVGYGGNVLDKPIQELNDLDLSRAVSCNVIEDQQVCPATSNGVPQ